MKMSKSINDYKEAMDNIKISESFYKRTEVLLTEIPEVKIEKRPVLNSRRISAVIMSAAACAICIFGVKLAVDGRQAGIVTETVADMDGGEIGDITETGRDADELIDDFTEYDDDIIAESDSFILDGGDTDNGQDTPTESKPVAANPATSPETEKTTTPAETKATTKETTTTTTQTTTASESRVVQGIDPNKSSANATSEPNDADADEEPAALPNPRAYGGGSSDGEEADDDTDVMDSEEEYDEVAPAASAPTVSDKRFSELSLNNITVDITPYFDMGNIKSGEGTVKKSGMEFKPILDFIADMDSSATKISNNSFTSLFSMRIYDENIDLEFYSIYLTNHESIVITKHSPDGSQVRETYALRRDYYESVRHQLFLLFGAEGDYELFTNLIGGK